MKKNTSKKLNEKKHSIFTLSTKEAKAVHGGGVIIHGAGCQDGQDGVIIH